MLPGELISLTHYSERLPCISILLPLRQAARNKKNALLLAENAIRQLANVLHDMCPEQAGSILVSLWALIDDLDREYDPITEGIGLYAAPGFRKLYRFLFPIQEKVHIGRTFSIRELLYQEQFAIDYFVLHLSPEAVQCYKGRLHSLYEIKDGIFPRVLRDKNKYAGAVKSAAVNPPRVETFYCEADQPLNDILGELPLIIAGTKKDVSRMQEITHHQKNIIATITGIDADLTAGQLQEKAWLLIKNWIAGKERLLIPELIREKWQQHAVDGISAVWSALQEDRGRRLLVEKDYSPTAFLDKKDRQVVPESAKIRSSYYDGCS